MVVDWNIRLKPNTPKEVISKLRAWHKNPHNFDHLLDQGIDVAAALGAYDSEGFAGVLPEANFIHGSGVVSYIRTSANFKHRREGVNRLFGFLAWLEPWIDHRDEVIGIVRGEDDLYELNDTYVRTSFAYALCNEEPEPSKAYSEIRIINNYPEIKFTRGDLHGSYPWLLV